MKVSGIYQIQNLVNGKIYIGSAINFEFRKSHHFGMLRRNCHYSQKLQNAYNKYGVNNFEFSIVEYCELQELIKQEQYYLDVFDATKNGYNICQKAGNTYGYRHTKASKEKMSKSRKGLVQLHKYKPHSENTKNKISLALKGNPILKQKKGSLSKEHKTKISITRINKQIAKGSKNSCAKLTENKIYEIVESYNYGKSTKELADIYQVTRESIQNIIGKRTWKHLWTSKNNCKFLQKERI